MANWCGGIRLDKNTLKIIDGVICDANAATVDRSKAVSTCGQLWDGASFKVKRVDGCPVITLLSASGVVEKTLGNCGVGLDGRFFKVVNGAVALQEGFMLTVDVTPNDAIITVTDSDGETIEPVSGNAKQFLLKGIGDTYTVTATKTGYTTEAKQVKNTGDQTFTIVMKAAT